VRRNGEVRTSRLDALAAIVIVVTLAAFARDAVGTDAAFAVPTENPGNSFSSIPDWKPPIVSRATVVKAEGGIPGYVRAGGSYTFVASVVDDPSSNPPAGIASVQATAATLTGSGTPIAMPANAATVDGLTYTHRTAAATVPAARAAGTYGSSITARDLVTPANTSAAFAVTTIVDNTAPTRTSATVANGGVAGRMGAGDTITYLWSEIIDPQSVLAGWSGASTPVTVRVNNAGGATGDTVTIRNAANTAQLPLGSLETNTRDFITALTEFGGPANATRSTMAWNASTGAITVTFGPPDAAGTINTNGNNTATYEWFPQAVYDRAGNLSNTTTYTEPGAADREF
jgi:hypothetical protein